MTAATRRQLMNAGRRIFAQQGLDGARVDAIAREAGVNKALINYHFRGKEGLYREVLAEELRVATEALESRLAAEPSPERRLLAWPAALASLLAERPSLAPLLLGEGLRAGPSLAGTSPGEALLASTLSQARGAGGLRPVVTRELQPLLLGGVLLAGLEGDAAPAAALLAGLLERGLLTTPPGSDSGDR